MLSPSLIFFNYLNGENECRCHDFPLIFKKIFCMLPGTYNILSVDFIAGFYCYMLSMLF